MVGGGRQRRLPLPILRLTEIADDMNVKFRVILIT